MESQISVVKGKPILLKWKKSVSVVFTPDKRKVNPKFSFWIFFWSKQQEFRVL